jgi:uncharacterized Zn finger protein (UPF0148 family)
MPKVDIRELILDDECPYCGSFELFTNEDGLLECDECGELIVEEDKPIRKLKNNRL